MAQGLSDQDWNDLVARKATGQIYGVTTTRILCRFGCPSRPPKRGNAVLIKDMDQALAAGFRPCKRCRPDVRKGP